jgi:hypothetical protein
VQYKVSWVKLSTGQQDEVDALLRPPGWRIIAARDLPSVFPQPFRTKIDSALLIAERTSTGGTYLAVSANRVDAKAEAIDIEPMGVIVHSTGSGSTGAFIHHGSWAGRTQAPPSGFWRSVTVSGIRDYFLANPPQGLREGSLDQLPTAHRGAFDAIVQVLRAREDRTK